MGDWLSRVRLTNCASACSNHTSGCVFQKVGSLRLTTLASAVVPEPSRTRVEVTNVAVQIFFFDDGKTVDYLRE